MQYVMFADLCRPYKVKKQPKNKSAVHISINDAFCSAKHNYSYLVNLNNLYYLSLIITR